LQRIARALDVDVADLLRRARLVTGGLLRGATAAGREWANRGGR